MTESDISLIRCVDCHGDLTIITADTIEQRIINGIIKCNQCEREFPVLREVGIFFRKQVVDDYLNDGERIELGKLSYSSAFSDPKEITTGDEKQLAVSRNWEHQWNQVFS